MIEVCPELEYVHRGSPGSLGSPNTFIYKSVAHIRCITSEWEHITRLLRSLGSPVNGSTIPVHYVR